MPETVLSRFEGDETRRQRPSRGIGGALVRAPAAVGAGVEIEHVLPGEVFEGLNSERFHLIQMFIADAPAHRFQNFPVQLCEVNIEEGRFHVELDSKGAVAQQEEEGQIVQEVASDVKILQRL